MRNFIKVQYKGEELYVNVNCILFVKPVRYGSVTNAQLHINVLGRNEDIKYPSEGTLFVPTILLLDSTYEYVLNAIDESLDI